MRAVRLSRAIAGAALAVAAALLVLPAPAGVGPAVMPAAALAVLTVGLWATGALAPHLTALTFFLLAMLFAVAPPAVVFSGFHSSAVWLVFGGLVIGVAVRRSGLAERAARAFASRLDASYPAVIAGIVAIGTVMAFFVPSSLGRVLILTPIVLALADRLSFAAGSRGRAGMALAASLGTVLPGFGILPANVPNMVLIGASETLYGMAPAYGAYLLQHFPVTGALKALALVPCICLLLPDRPRPSSAHAAAGETAGDGAARRLMVILGVSLALWASDFVHHISPAWIALGAALACLLPRIGMVPPSAFNGEVNYGSMFYVAGVLGLGAVVSDSGLGDALARALVEAIGFTPGEHGRNFAALSLLTMAVGLATTIPALPAVMTPLGAVFADATGLPLETVLMTQVIGFSTIILPYQSPPIIIGVQLAGVRLGDAVRVTLATTAVTVVALLPLNYLWWSVLGAFP